MRWDRLALYAVVVLSPPLAYGLFLLVYDYRVRRRHRRTVAARRITVADLLDRLNSEDGEESAVTPHRPRDEHELPPTCPGESASPELPRGWRWPSLDPDDVGRGDRWN
ncbi:hypothetical protein GCM10009754_73910 [Amycolatopsis minnesotensis]|uniref:Secreted protein n=1 Tax=Amycolatopsis minnesotensis TaxID=337894 RepID=A0ABP5DSA9_9PSEU